MRPTSREVFQFGLVGCTGFLVDAGLTLALTQALPLAPELSRVVGFVCAATITWELNRRFTFRSSAGKSSWLPYVLVAAAGALLNFGIFLAWIRFAGTAWTDLLTGIAFGAVAAMGFTFSVSRRYVFRSR